MENLLRPMDLFSVNQSAKSYFPRKNLDTETAMLKMGLFVAKTAESFKNYEASLIMLT